jgi:hypothetical protein
MHLSETGSQLYIGELYHDKDLRHQLQHTAVSSAWYAPAFGILLMQQLLQLPLSHASMTPTNPANV